MSLPASAKRVQSLSLAALRVGGLWTTVPGLPRALSAGKDRTIPVIEKNRAD